MSAKDTREQIKFEKLPEEILLMIAQYLSGKDLSTFLLINKLLNNLGKDDVIWKKNYLDYFPHDHIAEAFNPAKHKSFWYEKNKGRIYLEYHHPLECSDARNDKVFTHLVRTDPHAIQLILRAANSNKINAADLLSLLSLDDTPMFLQILQKNQDKDLWLIGKFYEQCYRNSRIIDRVKYHYDIKVINSIHCWDQPHDLLIRAASFNHINLAKYLIASYSIAKFLKDSNKINRSRNALHEACFHGHEEIVELLIKAGAPTYEYDALGRTPFHLACLQGYSRIVEMLLTSGFDPNSKTRKGKTALELLTDNLSEYSFGYFKKYQPSKLSYQDVIDLLKPYAKDELPESESKSSCSMQ